MFILNFHGLGDPKRKLPGSEQRVWISETFFESILDWVKDRNNVGLTFDDANESDYTIALPALQARNMKAQFFIVADRVGCPGYLSRGQIANLVAADMVIGSHGMRHRPWATLQPMDLDEELLEARSRLEQMTNLKINAASCPFGSYNRRVIRALRSAGYQRIYTSDGGFARPGSLILPRNSIYHTHNLAAIKQISLDKPGAGRLMWRQLKLALKRWR
jgi:peptidoglycan/xylan/chitin deacetylase (PgdA/CDA1 family)